MIRQETYKIYSREKLSLPIDIENLPKVGRFSSGVDQWPNILLQWNRFDIFSVTLAFSEVLKQIMFCFKFGHIFLVKG